MGLIAFLDTNAIIGLLKNDGNINNILRKYTEIHISIISIVEFRSFDNISEIDLDIFEIFLSRVNIIDLIAENNQLLNKIIELRKTKKLKLPDAVVAASAIILNADLFTADKNFSKTKQLNIVTW